MHCMYAVGSSEVGIWDATTAGGVLAGDTNVASVCRLSTVKVHVGKCERLSFSTEAKQVMNTRISHIR